MNQEGGGSDETKVGFEEGLVVNADSAVYL